jgi:TonB family protein
VPETISVGKIYVVACSKLSLTPFLWTELHSRQPWCRQKAEPGRGPLRKGSRGIFVVSGRSPQYQGERKMHMHLNTGLMRSAFCLVVAASLLGGCVSTPPPRPMFHGYPWPLDTQGHQFEGTTLVMGLVEATGHMTQACINRSSGNADLDRLAVQWLATRHFNPEIKNGVPVEGYARVPVVFQVKPTTGVFPRFPRDYCQTRSIADLLKSLPRSDPARNWGLKKAPGTISTQNRGAG